MTIRHVSLPLHDDFLFVALHSVDKRSFSSESQDVAATLLVNEIIRVEEQYQNERTVIVGDFNMNPFETSMVKTTGFHGTMSSEVARAGARTVQGQDYKCFYNPTWSLFGDLNKTVSGTYYYHRSEHVCYEWNIFDQVLLRPAMIDNFVNESLEIVSTDSVNLLVTNKGRPDRSSYSDHLPLFFTLKF